MSNLIQPTKVGLGARVDAYTNPTSFYRTPLTANAPWMFANTAPGSEDDLVTRLRLQSNLTKSPDARSVYSAYGYPYSTTTNDSQFAMPVYIVPYDQPTVKVTLVDQYQTKTQQSHFNAVPMPKWQDCHPGGNDLTHQAAANGTDSSIIVVRGYEYWEIWTCFAQRSHVVLDPPTASQVTQGTTANAQWSLISPQNPTPLTFNNTRTVAAGDTCVSAGNAFISLAADGPSAPTGYTSNGAGYVADYRKWSGIWNPSHWGVHATGTSLTGGILTAEDCLRAVANQNKPLAQQSINHMLSVALPITGAASSLASATPGDLSGAPSVYPAVRYDSFDFAAGGDQSQERIPEGIRFRLEPTVTDDQIMAWAQSQASRNIASALSIFLTNKAARDYGIIVEDTAGVVAYIAEDPRTSGTPYSPYPAGGTWKNGFWGSFGYCFMWQYMKTLAPLT